VCRNQLADRTRVPLARVPRLLQERMLILTQFLLRLTFGLALSMAITSPRLVTSGYFRNHLYVLLGMNVLAALVAWRAPDQFSIWPPLAAAVLGYAGAVAWLYEKPKVGRTLLTLVAIAGISGAWLATPAETSAAADSPVATALRWLDAPTSGLLLGSTLAAMFLGHWYLNTPTMELAPLERLVLLAGAATAARAIVCGGGLALEIEQFGMPQPAFIALRWLSGLVGASLLFVMTWKTLKIPNTQSATGILYVAVIAVFLGELTSQLLSARALFPL
jgi:hypothetical protein